MARYAYNQYKDIVGKAVRMEDTLCYEDARGLIHYCNWAGGHNILAYCKGKNGHYYLGKGWGSRYNVFRVQRITQRGNYEIVDYFHCKVEEDSAYDPKSLADAVLERFEDVVALHTPARYKSRSARDFQRRKVYRWETVVAETLDVECKRYQPQWHLSQENSIKLVQMISDWANIKTPTVVYRPGAASSWAKGTYKIQLAVTTPDVIVHEMCHILMTYLSKDLIAGHGPEFVGMLIHMNEVFLGWDSKKAVEIANNQGVKYDFKYVNLLQQRMKVAA